MTGEIPHHTTENNSILGLSWLKDIREHASRTFMEKGFPSKRNESWKYTSIGQVIEKNIDPVHARASAVCQSPLVGSYVITLIDGELDMAQSEIPDELSVIRLDKNDLSPEVSRIFQKLHRREDISEDSTTQVALNIARADQALLIHVPKGKNVDRVIEIHHVLSGSSVGGRYTQLWLDQDVDSNVTLLERFYGTDAGGNEKQMSSLQNHVSYIGLDKGATLYHYRLQDSPLSITHLYTARLTQSDHSVYRSFTLTSGATLSRQEIRSELNGSHIVCDQKGVTLGRNKQHHDAYLPVTHHQPESSSNQHFRQLLDDQSKGVFYGSIQVPKSSIKTESHQLNQNILLSPAAQAFTRPELDIFTDDVVCTHGATVGDLDEQAMYYLQSRGLDENQSKNILVKAFAEEVIVTIENPSIMGLMLGHIQNATSKSRR